MTDDTKPSMDLELHFAQWRLDNPGAHGWPFDAFRAGWDACAEAREAEPEPQRMFGLDIHGDLATVVTMELSPHGLFWTVTNIQVMKLDPSRLGIAT